MLLHRLILAGVLFALLSFRAIAADVPHKTENLFLITVDGFRWQEVFGGAEESLINAENGGVVSTNRVRAAFLRKTPEKCREALLPFVWSEIAHHGQIFGNRNKGSLAQVTNGKKFTYPGFNEM